MTQEICEDCDQPVIECTCEECLYCGEDLSECCCDDDDFDMSDEEFNAQAAMNARYSS